MCCHGSSGSVRARAPALVSIIRPFAFRSRPRCCADSRKRSTSTVWCSPFGRADPTAVQTERHGGVAYQRGREMAGRRELDAVVADLIEEPRIGPHRLAALVRGDGAAGFANSSSAAPMDSGMWIRARRSPSGESGSISGARAAACSQRAHHLVHVEAFGVEVLAGPGPQVIALGAGWSGQHLQQLVVTS